MFGFSTLMIHTKLLDKNNENNNLIFSENLYKGACVKIKNSNKTFQVIGLNRGKEICWVREWPFACNSKKTFALEISQITLQIFCSNNSSEKNKQLWNIKKSCFINIYYFNFFFTEFLRLKKNI